LVKAEDAARARPGIAAYVNEAAFPSVVYNGSSLTFLTLLIASEVFTDIHHMPAKCQMAVGGVRAGG